MGWENAPVDDTATIDRWQWRMNTPKSEADSAVPSFKDVWQTINPLQHIPIIGSIYRGLTGDTPTPTARALGGMLYGGPIGALIAGISGAARDIVGGDPIERSVARLAGTTEAAPAMEIAAGPVSAATAAPLPTEAAAAPAAAPAQPLAAAPTALKPAPAVEPAKELARAPVAADPVDPYARFQPKRATVQHGNRIAQNLAALNMTTMTGPQLAQAKPAAGAKPEAAPQPAAVAPPAPATSPAAGNARATTPPPTPTRETSPAGTEPNGQTQVWFSQAVLGALDRYRAAGGLRPPVATAKSVDTSR